MWRPWRRRAMTCTPPRCPGMVGPRSQSCPIARCGGGVGALAGSLRGGGWQAGSGRACRGCGCLDLDAPPGLAPLTKALPRMQCLNTTPAGPVARLFGGLCAAGKRASRGGGRVSSPCMQCMQPSSARRGTSEVPPAGPTHTPTCPCLLPACLLLDRWCAVPWWRPATRSAASSAPAWRPTIQAWWRDWCCSTAQVGLGAQRGPQRSDRGHWPAGGSADACRTSPPPSPNFAARRPAGGGLLAAARPAHRLAAAAVCGQRRQLGALAGGWGGGWRVGRQQQRQHTHT